MYACVCVSVSPKDLMIPKYVVEEDSHTYIIRSYTYRRKKEENFYLYQVDVSCYFCVIVVFLSPIIYLKRDLLRS